MYSFLWVCIFSLWGTEYVNIIIEIRFHNKKLFFGDLGYRYIIGIVHYYISINILSFNIMFNNINIYI